MRAQVGLGRFDQGFESQRLTIGVFARLVLSDSVLPNVEPEEFKAWLVAFQGMT